MSVEIKEPLKDIGESSVKSWDLEGFVSIGKEDFKLAYGCRGPFWAALAKGEVTDVEMKGMDIPVVMVHGWLDSYHSYDTVVPLMKSRNILAISQRGWGKSSRPDDSTYEIAQYAEDIVAVLKTMKLTRIHLVGHSMGSLVTQYLASHFSEYFISLILIGSTPQFNRKLRTESCVYAWLCCGCCCCPGLRMTDKKQLRELQEVDTMVSRKHISKERGELIMAETYQADHKAIIKSMDSLIKYNGTTFLPKIKCPTLLIWGTMDSMFTMDQQKLLLKGIAGSELKVVDKAMHGVHWTHPPEAAKLMDEFLVKF